MVTFIELLLLVVLTLSAASAGASGVAKNPQAVQRVLAGKRTVANAAWWGFDEEDSTDALQAAIDSGAKKVIVPNVGKDWIVRPIRLAGNQELVLQRGVAIVAKRGEFRGKGDCLFRGSNIANLTIRGYGATLRMRKEDYMVGAVLKDYFNWNRWFGQYAKAEWRTGITLDGCSNVRISGVTIRDTGGDGIMLSGGKVPYCEDVVLKDVTCDNNYRQGISIIGVDGMIADNCAFKNTWGTPPSSGVDIEPDSPDQRVRGVVFRNCRFADNYGDGIEVFLPNLKRQSGDVSIRFEDCDVTSTRGAGVRIAYVNADGPGGVIEFDRCRIHDTVGYGIKVQAKSPRAARVRFVDCALHNVADTRAYEDEWTPIWLRALATRDCPTYGGITFERCTVDDRWDRPAVTLKEAAPPSDIAGHIVVANPHGVRTELRAGVVLALRVTGAEGRWGLTGGQDNSSRIAQ